MVEELFPASVAVVAEVDVDHGIVSWSRGLLDQCHAGTLRDPAALFHVAAGTRAHDILPVSLAAHA